MQETSFLFNAIKRLLAFGESSVLGRNRGLPRWGGGLYWMQEAAGRRPPATPKGRWRMGIQFRPGHCYSLIEAANLGIRFRIKSTCGLDV